MFYYYFQVFPLTATLPPNRSSSFAYAHVAPPIEPNDVVEHPPHSNTATSADSKGAVVVSAAGSEVGSRRRRERRRTPTSAARQASRVLRHVPHWASAAATGSTAMGAAAMRSTAEAASVRPGMIVLVRERQALVHRRRFPSTAALRNEKADGARRSPEHAEALV